MPPSEEQNKRTAGREEAALQLPCWTGAKDAEDGQWKKNQGQRRNGRASNYNQGASHFKSEREKSFIVFRIVLLQELAKGSSSAPTASYVHPDF